jgi:hypothetical protein
VFDTIFDLPVHALVVHATVVIVPTAAGAVALAAASPRFRRWAGILPLLLSVVSIVLVLVSTRSGEALSTRVGGGDRVHTHSELGDQLIYPVVVLAVGAIALFWVRMKEQADSGSSHSSHSSSSGRPGVAVMAVISLVAVVGAVGTAVQVARVGHSGAQAAWADLVANTSSTGSK